MMTESGAALPRWGGITEPMTVLTNAILAAVAFVLGARLAYAAAAEGRTAGEFLALGLLSTAFAAALGAAAHGIDPRVDRALRERCWRGALYVTGLAGASTIASVAYFAARGPGRAAILAIAGIKLVVYLAVVVRRPAFRVTAMDYGSALAGVLVGAAYADARWGTPAGPWLISGIAVSLIGGLVQGRRLALHRHFNHNDFFHVIQIVAIYLFYRGGTLLVDR